MEELKEKGITEADVKKEKNLLGMSHDAPHIEHGQITSQNETKHNKDMITLDMDDPLHYTLRRMR